MLERDSSLPPPLPSSSREVPTQHDDVPTPADGPWEQASSALSPALVVDGRYRVKGELGRGGMGVVYLAKDIWLDRKVALKVLEPTWSRDSRAAARFLREAKALAHVRSPNIVQVHSFGMHMGSYFLAMEYVAGRGLSAILDDHRAHGAPMSVRSALAILEPIMRGIGAMHAAGFVHRDVKPANIMIESGTGRPVLVDFGLVEPDDARASRILIVGTPRYMAPEQAAGGALITAQSDIYSLGCVAFEMLTGQTPFDRAGADEQRRAHRYTAPPAASSLRPELASFDRALCRALAKSPADRFESCDGFADALVAAAAAERGRTPAYPFRVA